MRGTAVTIALVALAAGAASAGEAAPTVRVDGRLMVVNGQAEVPRGLFGVHAFGLTDANVADLGIECIRQIHFGPGSGSSAIDPEGRVKPLYRKLSVVIDCQGDRYCPATVLSSRDYEAFFTRIGTQYAERCKAAGWKGYVEFWNEPYLNWASRSHGAGRCHYYAGWYDVSKAVDGGPVTIKGWDKPLDHLRWRRLWARGEDGKIYYGVAIPPGLKPGDTFRGHSPKDWYWTNRQEQTFTVVEEWSVYDPTQVGFWSGRQNLQFYLWMFLPFAKAVKQANPDVQVLAGWDFGLSHGDWAVWRELYQPLLDAGIAWIDGITEHHYGVDTRCVTAWYEVAVAYTMSRHGKWIRGFNTECAGKLDPAVYGRGAAEVTADAAATYMLRDILELCHHSPAKAGARTTHHPGAGELAALRFLKDLRGPLLCTHSEDVQVWPTACINDGRLVLVLFNNASQPRQAAISLAAPSGTAFQAGTIAAFGGKEERLAASGREATVRRTLAPLEAVKIVLPLDGRAADRPTVARRQFFAKEGVLLDVAPDKPLTLHVDVDAAVAAKAERLRLKVVLEKAGSGEARAAVNGTPVAIPDGAWTMEVPLPTAALRAANEIVFTCEGPGADGYRVDAASLLVDAPLP